MVKPDKARRVEEMLIHAAKSGALPGKVTEDHFIQMLGQVRRWSPFPKASNVVVVRFRCLLRLLRVMGRDI